MEFLTGTLSTVISGFVGVQKKCIHGSIFKKRTIPLPLRPSYAFKVDKAIIRVCLYQAHTYFLSNSKAPFASQDPSFSRWGDEPDIRSFFQAPVTSASKASPILP